MNIITKSAKDTKGGLVTAGGGTEERGFGEARYGGERGDNLTHRIYGKYVNRDALYHESTSDYDDWQTGQMGFRTDWDMTEQNNLILQGDFYKLYVVGQREYISLYSAAAPFSEWREEHTDTSGANILGHWHSDISNSSDFTLQCYYDMSKQVFPSGEMDANTFDIDMQHSFQLTSRQEIIWGLGYRIQPYEKLFLDLATFYNVYDNYMSAEVSGSWIIETPALIYPAYSRNKLKGRVYGGELSVKYEPFDWWRLGVSHSV